MTSNNSVLFDTFSNSVDKFAKSEHFVFSNIESDIKELNKMLEFVKNSGISIDYKFTQAEGAYDDGFFDSAEILVIFEDGDIPLEVKETSLGKFKISTLGEVLHKDLSAEKTQKLLAKEIFGKLDVNSKYTMVEARNEYLSASLASLA